MALTHKKAACGVVLLSMVALAAAGFLCRDGILARYYSWRLDSADERIRWTAADRLRTLEPARAESWYISRLKEDPEWENRKRAAASLGKMMVSSRAVAALLELEHPRYPRGSIEALTAASGTKYARTYSIVDLAPASAPGGEDQKLFLEFLDRHTEGVLSSRGKSGGVSLDEGKLFVRATLGAHEALATLLDTLRITRKTLREIGPRALIALEELERCEEADPALRLHTRLELSVLESNQQPADPPPPVPVPVLVPVQSLPAPR